jgi:hypothetical protein
MSKPKSKSWKLLKLEVAGSREDWGVVVTFDDGERLFRHRVWAATLEDYANGDVYWSESRDAARYHLARAKHRLAAGESVVVGFANRDSVEEFKPKAPVVRLATKPLVTGVVSHACDDIQAERKRLWSQN